MYREASCSLAFETLACPGTYEDGDGLRLMVKLSVRNPGSCDSNWLEFAVGWDRENFLTSNQRQLLNKELTAFPGQGWGLLLNFFSSS